MRVAIDLGELHDTKAVALTFGGHEYRVTMRLRIAKFLVVPQRELRQHDLRLGDAFVAGQVVGNVINAIVGETDGIAA